MFAFVAKLHSEGPDLDRHQLTTTSTTTTTTTTPIPVRYVLLIESSLPVLLIAVFYWTFSAIFLQFMKRAANCATASLTAEAFVFQLQHTADLFFVLLYINSSFPSLTFFLLCIWNFVQVGGWALACEVALITT